MSSIPVPSDVRAAAINKVSRERIIDRTGAEAIAVGVPGTLPLYAGSDQYVGTIAPGYDVRFFDIDNLFNRARQIENFFPYLDVQGNFYDVREQVRSAYAIYQGKFDWGSVIGGVRFDFEPDAEPVRGLPDRRHLGAGVAWDHATAFSDSSKIDKPSSSTLSSTVIGTRMRTPLP